MRKTSEKKKTGRRFPTRESLEEAILRLIAICPQTKDEMSKILRAPRSTVHDALAYLRSSRGGRRVVVFNAARPKTIGRTKRCYSAANGDDVKSDLQDDVTETFPTDSDGIFADKKSDGLPTAEFAVGPE